MSEFLGLIIEDDPSLAEIYKEALVFAGYRPDIVANGRLALEYLKTVKPDLILLDLHLPEVSGKDILQKIKENEKLATTKVLITSADLLMAEELRDDVAIVLVKPISFMQLSNLAKRFLPERMN